MKELQEYVNSIRADLNRIYEAEYTESEQEQAEQNGEAYDFYGYFNDVLDVEYTANYRREYVGVRIAVALGGPNVYINTRAGEVQGYWGTDKAVAWIPAEICEAIDSIFEEYYNN